MERPYFTNNSLLRLCSKSSRNPLCRCSSVSDTDKWEKHSLRQFKRFFNAVTSTGEQYIGLLRLAVLPTDLRLNVRSWTFLDLTRFIFYIFQLKFILSWLSGLHESFYLVPFTGDGPP